MIGFSGDFRPTAASRRYMYWRDKVWRTGWEFCGFHPNGCGKILLRWRGE